MSDEKKLIVGMDLCNDYTQLSIYNHTKYEVESFFIDSEEQDSKIPTVLAVREDTKEWLFGKEALQCGYERKGHLLKNFLSYSSPKLDIFGIEFTRVQIYEKYLRKVLLLLKRDYPNETIHRLVITIKRPEFTLMQELYEALEGMGLKKDRVRILSHEQSYLYFALSQKKELWMNDVALFEYDRDGMCYYQISIDRRTRPMLVGLEKKDFSETMTYSMIKEKPDSLSHLFENITTNVLYKQIISTIYLTGSGFEANWIKPILQQLCIGHRLFMGQNLYCYGACYAAKEIDDSDKLANFAFLSSEALSYSVSMKMYAGGEFKNITLVETATPWYEVNQKFSVILDDEMELIFVLRDALKKTTQTRIIALEGLETELRMERGTRLDIMLTSNKEKELVITIRDKGFGAIYPSSNRIWERIISY